MCLDKHTLMMASPCPVVDTAPTKSSANPPAPTRGVSPTRPLLLAVMPPVDVAQATWPAESTATAPTVSWSLQEKEIIVQN